MHFTQLPSIFPGQQIYGALKGRCSYVITKDALLSPPFLASMKDQTSPRARTVYLGAFDSFEAAKRACRGHDAYWNSHKRDWHRGWPDSRSK